MQEILKRNTQYKAEFKGIKMPIYILAFSHIKSMEKAMATHSSTLAWKLPWTEDPGRLLSRGSLRVGHN